jgi:LPXTG-motif cell wall-anchored protein
MIVPTSTPSKVTIGGKDYEPGTVEVLPALTASGQLWVYGLQCSAGGDTTTANGTSVLLDNTMSYYLKETVAPTGYILPTDPDDQTAFNIQSTAFSGLADDVALHEILNQHQGFLPSTGGGGIYMLLAIGLVGMGIIAILWRRNKKRENQGYNVD